MHSLIHFLIYLLFSGLHNSALITGDQSVEMTYVQDVKQTNDSPEKPAIDDDMTQVENTVV